MNEKPRRRLEDLVPPLDLCKQIPEGEFRNSVLVWVYYYAGWHDNREWSVFERTGEENVDLYYPAPTLVEILEDLAGKGVQLPQPYLLPSSSKKHGRWIVLGSWRKQDRVVSAERLEVAALTLWLEFYNLLEGGSK